MVTLLSPIRVYKGILINIVNGESNHACHEATILKPQSPNTRTKYLAALSQITLPYLYFASKLLRDAVVNAQKLPEDRVEELRFEGEKFINTVIA